MRLVVASSPRNQSYLPLDPLGAGLSVCEVDKRSKLAKELNPQLPIVRHEPDLFH